MKIKGVVIFVILVFLTTFVLYCGMPLSLDAVWDYGFGYNIYSGLVPYRDFSMIIPPLFSYIVAFILKIMGNNFIVYYIIISSLIVGITFLGYQKIKYKACFLYFFLLIYPYNGYNVFGVFLMFLLLCLLDKDSKYNDVFIACLVSFMCLSKQTLGLLIIPSIIYAKSKKKVISLYLIVFLLFFLYLILNNNLFQFIDYCFLGMFDFASKNSSGIDGFFVFELFVCIYILWEFVRSKFREKSLFYILLFQIISFPITDFSHFVLTFSPVIYYLFFKYGSNVRFVFLFSIVLLSYILGAVGQFGGPNTWVYDDIYLNKNSVFNYKRVPNYMINYFDIIDRFKNEYPNYRLYLLDSRAYVGKLELGLKIDKYDLINDGNMGYKGDIKYINEIDSYCKKNKCLFIVNEEEVRQDINQTNDDIISYVNDNYLKIYGSNIDSVYRN